MHFGTCTTARTDGHGRLIDQILRNQQPGLLDTEYHRLWTYYRNDGAVLELVRLQTDSDSSLRPADHGDAETTSDPHVFRTFIYDTVGRRIGSDDPDTNNPDADPDEASWRYLFNRVGDLVAVRDPRGCGQNFLYDLGGRLLGEQYVACDESQTSARELPTEELADVIGMSTFTDATVDVRYFYDALPDWVGGADPAPDPAAPGSANLLGRATGVTDRAQRAAVSYDDRGNAIWTARQIAVISTELDLTLTLTGDFPVAEEVPGSSSDVVYDEDHTYVRTASFDHANRPTDMALPRDPDWDDTDSAPLVTGTLTYNGRGLPATVSLTVDDGVSPVTVPIVTAIQYLRDGLVGSIEYGDIESMPVVTSTTSYDERRRPVHMSAVRMPTDSSGLRGVSAIADQELQWDAASNLTGIVDLRDPAEWPEQFRPQSVQIEHDSLYRVVGALFDYSLPGDDPDSTSLGEDTASDWRDEAAASNAVDPMNPEPAPMMSATMPAHRVQYLGWEWDWLGNMQEWTDDAQQFYERSIGDIVNGHEIENGRPSALYIASNVDDSMAHDRGWVELDYGAGGNVTAVTVHARCEDVSMMLACEDDPEELDSDARREALRTNCDCAYEQHFQYRWDELNRIAEARRFDQTGGSGSNWTFEARQRYRYDGANARVIKQSFVGGSGDHRLALYVYPGDFERRGLVRDTSQYASASSGVTTETQYTIAEARLVYEHDVTSGFDFVDPNRRLTMPIGDLLHTGIASVDLMTAELLEVCTYYPNGSRETLRVDDALEEVPLEPNGFTGKEADDEVGLVYFGERYLLARIGRWASPDPLSVHAAGGGDSLNSYHYIAGNMLAARDALGLQAGIGSVSVVPRAGEQGSAPTQLTPLRTESGLTIEASPWASVQMHRDGDHSSPQVGTWIGVRGPGADRTSIVQVVSLRAESRAASGDWHGYRGSVQVGGRTFAFGRTHGSDYQVDHSPSDPGGVQYDRCSGDTCGIGALGRDVHGVIDRPHFERAAMGQLLARPGQHEVRVTATFETFVQRWVESSAGVDGHFENIGVVHWSRTTVATRLRPQREGESAQDYARDGVAVHTEDVVMQAPTTASDTSHLDQAQATESHRAH